EQTRALEWGHAALLTCCCLRRGRPFKEAAAIRGCGCLQARVPPYLEPSRAGRGRGHALRSRRRMSSSGGTSGGVIVGGQAPTVLPRATTSPRERVQTGTNAACLWSVKSLQGRKNSEAAASRSTSWGSLVRAQYRPLRDACPSPARRRHA